MSWLDRIQKGTWRGLSFSTVSSQTTFGRKVAIYTIPFEDRGVASVDLGRAPRVFKLKLFLLGDDYDIHRDSFIEALETKGPGLLVHPKHGRVNVVIASPVTITESTDMGGMAEVDFDAIEARETASPVPKSDTKAATVAAADNLRVQAGASFVDTFSVDGVPDFVALSNLAVLDNIIDGITDINQTVGAILEVPSHFAAQINAISEQTAALLNTPQLLYNTVDSVVASIMQSIRRVRGSANKGLGNLQQVVVMSEALGADTPVPRRGTPSRDVERNNRAQMLIAMRSSALASTAIAAAESEYASANDAREVLQTLTSALSSLSDDTVDDIEPTAETYDALRDLLGALTAHLSAMAENLAEITTHTPGDTVPALLIAYQLYGDAERVEELLARNPAIVHPLLVPGAIPLEILTP